MLTTSGNGYTLLLIHTWILWAVPIGVAVVAFVIGRLTKVSGPKADWRDPSKSTKWVVDDEGHGQWEES